jgi:hypothetical protein
MKSLVIRSVLVTLLLSSVGLSRRSLRTRPRER